MAVKLPSPEEIGLTPPQPDRSIATYQPGATGEAEEAVGSINSQTGAALEQTGNQLQQINDTIATSNATQQFIGQKLKLDDAARNDPDYATLPQRYNQSIDQALQQTASTIPGAPARADFMDRMSRYGEMGTNQALAISHQKSVDADRGYLDDMVDKTTTMMAQAPDDLTRAGLGKSLDDTVDALVAKGSVSQVEGVKVKQTALQNYAVKRATALTDLNPSAAVDVLSGQSLVHPGVDPAHGGLIGQAAAANGVDADTLGRTAALESNGDPTAINKATRATGLFQFEPATASSLGVNPTDPASSANGAARLMAQNTSTLTQALNRPPQPYELYMAHQQGASGAAALIENPNRNAVAVLSDVYGNQSNAVKAITSNGGNAKMSAGDFLSMWKGKFDDAAPIAGPTNAADAATGNTGQRYTSQSNGNAPAAPGPEPGEAVFQQTGTWLDALPIDKRAGLLDRANNMLNAQAQRQLTQARAAQTDQERQRTMNKQAQQDQSDVAKKALLADIAGVGQNPNVTAAQIADPTGPYKDLTPDDVKSMQSFYQSTKTFGEEESARQNVLFKTAREDASSALEQATIADIYGTGTNPGVTAAQISDPRGPYAALDPAAKLRMQALATDTTGKVAKAAQPNPASLGPAVTNSLARVWGDPNAADHISKIDDVLPLAGDPNGLTPIGVNRVQQEIDATKASPAEAQMKLNFYRDAASKIGVNDPTGRQQFQGFMQQSLEAYDAGKKNNLTPQQMLDPKSPDYLGRAVASFQRPYAQRLTDEMNARPQTADLSTPAALAAAVTSNQITREDAEALGIKNGWIKPAAAPGPQAPIAGQQ